ncbi:SsgA family sporulation/cell division regulator [Streptomyces sp. CA-100214]
MPDTEPGVTPDGWCTNTQPVSGTTRQVNGPHSAGSSTRCTAAAYADCPCGGSIQPDRSGATSVATSPAPRSPHRHRPPSPSPRGGGRSVGQSATGRHRPPGAPLSPLQAAPRPTRPGFSGPPRTGRTPADVPRAQPRPALVFARTRKRKGQILMKSVITCAPPLRLVMSDEYSLPAPQTCGNDTADPYAVHAAFHTGARGTVTWVFARDLLTEGLHRPAGPRRPDLALPQPGPEGRVHPRLESQEGRALLPRPDAQPGGLPESAQRPPCRPHRT